ncbi:DUF927 domain-containing protein [Methylobacterium sp. WL116]|uniref:DUF927 domain-containing protein n=1 Tax=Methylobacterium sp. WL116 TaxID=2603889 RepID=UPI0011C72B35|nr:DUF927 domain-containing protein [Methylobacterium sp. WL116]TXM94966.1 DUF927 domain-containing protein [Methylobacterium sp. WL116]
MKTDKPRTSGPDRPHDTFELSNNDGVPRILDAVVDQEGTRWIYYGTQDQACWFSPTELVSKDKAVFVRLSKTGTDLLANKTKTAFMTVVEQHSGYRPALVATRPGWLDKAHYVYGNGEVERPDGDTREVIIAFEPNPKFASVGTLAAWQASFGPVVANQPIPLFVMMYALVGAILRYAPAHVQNPQVELVGEGESAKTTMLTGAASVWAGDPTSDVGGAETWDMTANAHDPLKRAHADNLCALDEVNLAGLDSKNQREVVQKVAFKASTTGGRKRLTDTEAITHVRVATLSTSNVPQRDLLKAHVAIMDAFTSRILTIAIPKEHKLGVFRTVPNGFADAREAAEHLRTAVSENYGVAGRAFVKWLVAEVARDENGLHRKIKSLMNEFHNQARDEAVEKGKARGEKTVAITFVAGMLAGDAGVIPKDWGAPLSATLAVYHSLATAGDAPYTPPAIEEIRAYRARNRSDIARAKKLKRPYEEAAFLRKAGVLRRMGSRIELLIPAKRFQREFPDHRDMMKRLRDEGLARTEGGKQPKNTIKLPGRICRTAPRVYCITVVDNLKARPRRLKRAS